MSTDFKVKGANADAPFTLTLHRGEGMVLAAMNWKDPTPPDDFVGFPMRRDYETDYDYITVKQLVHESD